MLAFESLTPQDLLKEVAEYLCQLADNHAKRPATTQHDKARNTARVNALVGAAMDLEAATIIPANSILRKNKQRLEYLRGELRAERISYGELAELQSLAPHIDPSDVELLEPAGIPETQADADPRDFLITTLKNNPERRPDCLRRWAGYLWRTGRGTDRTGLA
jgi:hypothetical protein